MLQIGSLEISNVSNALFGLQSQYVRDRDAGGLKATKIKSKQSKHTSGSSGTFRVDLFTDTTAILNLKFKEYYGMLRGHSLSISRSLFGQKENFTVYFSGKRRSLLHPNTAQRSFSPLQSFSRKT